MQGLQDWQKKFTKKEVFAIETLSSTIAGVVAKTFSAPLDRAKVVLQTQRDWHSKKYKHKPYQSIWGTFQGLMQQQGVISLWRGNMANIARFIPSQSLMFGLHSNIFWKIIGQQSISDMTPMSIGIASMQSGSLSAGITLALTFHLYFCQTILAAHLGPLENSKFKTARSCVLEAHKIGGVLNVYNGFNATLFSVMTSRALYFGLYDLFKSYDREYYPQKVPWTIRWSEALIATIIAGLVAYPSDTVGRRLIMESVKTHQLYTSTYQCITHVYQKEGLPGFFAGSLANILRSISGAILLVLNDSLKLQIYIIAQKFKEG